MLACRSSWVLALVVMTSFVCMTSSQKVEKDGLDEDKYNLESVKGKDKAKAKAAEEASQKKSKGKDIKYVVTEEVYFDILVPSKVKSEDSTKRRVVIACFGEIVPITCLNFASLAKGHRARRGFLTYNSTIVHRVVKDFIIQMGDVTGKKGRSGMSIFGESFQDENFVLSHRGAGWVSMANHGRDTNGSQFFIMLQPARWLDGNHVVFGKVIKGMDAIRDIGELPTMVNQRPQRTVKIVASGIVGIASKYEMPLEDVMSQDDIMS